MITNNIMINVLNFQLVLLVLYARATGKVSILRSQFKSKLTCKSDAVLFTQAC